jgi:hypothetical protein
VLKVISTQVYETIYDLFWWEDGHFSFDLKLVESYKRIPFALSTEQVLLNILRMVDEWSEIEKKLFSPFLVLRKSTGSVEKSVDGLSSEAYFKEKLSTEQELIYNLVDGNRTVQEIIDRSLLGKFNTSDLLVGLMGMGLIEVVGVRTPSLIKKMALVNLRGAFTFLYYAVFCFSVFLIFVLIKPDFLFHFWDSKIERVDFQIPANVAHKLQLDRIKNALEIYHVEKGRYPQNLEELVSVQLLQKSDLFYRKGAAFHYEPKDGKYVLKH